MNFPWSTILWIGKKIGIREKMEAGKKVCHFSSHFYGYFIGDEDFVWTNLSVLMYLLCASIKFMLVKPHLTCFCCFVLVPPLALWFLWKIDHLIKVFDNTRYVFLDISVYFCIFSTALCGCKEALQALWHSWQWSYIKLKDGMVELFINGYHLLVLCEVFVDIFPFLCA